MTLNLAPDNESTVKLGLRMRATISTHKFGAPGQANDGAEVRTEAYLQKLFTFLDLGFRHETAALVSYALE